MVFRKAGLDSYTTGGLEREREGEGEAGVGVGGHYGEGETSALLRQWGGREKKGARGSGVLPLGKGQTGLYQKASAPDGLQGPVQSPGDTTFPSR